MGKAARAKRERREARVAAPPPARTSLNRAWLVGGVAALAATAPLAGAVAWATSKTAEPAAVDATTAATTAETAAEPGSAETSASGAVPGLQMGPAPWVAAQEQLPARLEAIGIPFSNMEGTAFHIHPVVSVFVRGDQVEVPTDIGISPAAQAMAALHTHDTAGTIHVESPVVRDYSLGLFFAVWGVRLTKRCVGGYCAGGGKGLRAFVDGKAVANPREIKLEDGERIVVAFGTAAQVKKANS